jgi:hypothetical protein
LAKAAAAPVLKPWEVAEQEHDTVESNGRTKGENGLDRQLKIQAVEDERNYTSTLPSAGR